MTDKNSRDSYASVSRFSLCEKHLAYPRLVESTFASWQTESQGSEFQYGGFDINESFFKLKISTVG